MSNARNLARLLPNASGQLPDANLAAIAAGKVSGQLADSNMSSGSVIQVVQSVMTTQFASNSGDSPVPIGLQTQIIPAKTSSKCLVSGNVYVSGNYTNMSHALILQRSINGGTFTNIGIGTSGGAGYGVTAWWNTSNAATDPSDGWQLLFEYLDSPATTSTVDYRVLARAYGGYMYINRNSRNSHPSFDLYPISTLTVKEIA